MIQYLLPLTHYFLTEIERKYYECAINEASAKLKRHAYFGEAYGAAKDKNYEVKVEVAIPDDVSYSHEGTSAVYTCHFRKSTGRLFLSRIDFSGHARSHGNRTRASLENFARRTLLHAEQDPRLQNSRVGSLQDGPLAVHPGSKRIRRVQFGREEQGKGNVRVPEPIQPPLFAQRQFRDATNPSRERELYWGGHHEAFAFEVPTKEDDYTEVGGETD